ncbi:MAG: NTP transferase domain-containing protein [Desulfocapsa sp.]|nr:NTP transferase domain-containing protein [Desulfocapsa sp.]
MSVDSTLYLVILAAGKGTRMKSDKAKVLHEVFYAPMIHHVLDAVSPMQPTKSIVVVGHQGDAVRKSLAAYTVDFAVQEEQLGTGHAVLCAEPAIDTLDGCVMILCGDTPLIRPETLQAMLRQHRAQNATLTVMTTILDDPTHYGRIISSDEGTVLAIVEEKDTDSEQKKIREINAGIYCIKTKFLFAHLKNIGTDNSQSEVYLTDIVTQAVQENLIVHKFINPAPGDVLGVNSRLELSQAHHELQLRRNRELMASGITMINPETIQVSPKSFIAKDVTLHPGIEIKGTSSISSGCDIEAGALLNNVTLGRNCRIGAYSCLEECDLPDNTSIDPHSHTC